MILVKENKEKHRKIFKDNNRYIKVWDNVNPAWITQHVNLLREYCPNLIDSYGDNWIAYNEIEGVTAHYVEHTDAFIRKVYKFCLESIEQTKPYVHGDWVLSNIIVHNNTLYMIDWDNIGIYPEQEYMNKLHSDLHSQFGDRFYDAAGI